MAEDGFYKSRKAKVEGLGLATYEAFVKPDGGEYLRLTGSLISHPSLRFAKTRRAVSIIMQAAALSKERRVLTKAVMRDAIAWMVKDKSLEIPMTAGFSWALWLDQQAKCVHRLSQNARKNCCFDKKHTMDAVETQPWNWYEDIIHQETKEYTDVV